MGQERSLPTPGRADSASTNPFAALRRFVRLRAPQECCELCSQPLAAEHPHLLNCDNRQLLCACEACAILFSGQQNGRFRRVPRDVQRLADFVLSDQQWQALGIPINLAFFTADSKTGRVLALYPSPGGAVEAEIPSDTWQELADANPVLRQLEPDVEALLVNRVGQARDYYRVPIDQCYRLVGLVRTHWRGLGGGAEVWGVIAQFFAELRAKSVSS